MELKLKSLNLSEFWFLITSLYLFWFSTKVQVKTVFLAETPKSCSVTAMSTAFAKPIRKVRDPTSSESFAT